MKIPWVYTENFFMLLNELGNSIAIAFNTLRNSIFIIIFNLVLEYQHPRGIHRNILNDME